MSAPSRAARTTSGPHTRDRDHGAPSTGRAAGAAGMLSLEAVLLLPVIALLVVGVLGVAVVIRDVLLVHEGARVGARAAATTSGTAPVAAAVREAVPELDVRVEVTPDVRGDGDLVTVVVATDRRLGPVTHPIRARAVARVEPAVGTLVGGAGHERTAPP